jgi:PAS domain S-box-containing protein
MELDTRPKTLGDPRNSGMTTLTRRLNLAAISAVTTLLTACLTAWIFVTGGRGNSVMILSCVTFLNATLTLLVLIPRHWPFAKPSKDGIDYRQIFTGNAGPMVIYDIESLRILDANPAALHFFGWSIEELPQLTLDSLWPAHLEEKLRLSMEEVRSVADQFHLLSTPLLLKDGTCRLMEVRGNAINHASGKARVLIAIDRSDEASAQQHQQQALARLEEAHRIARIGTWELDPATGLGLFSDQVYHLLGRPVPTSHRWRPHKELLIFADDTAAAEVERTFAKLCSGLMPRANLLLPMFASGGRAITVHLRGQTRFDPAGHPVNIACTLQDVTEQEASRRLLSEREEQFRELVRVLPDGVIILARGVVLYANATGADQFHTSRELLLGTSINELVNCEDLPLLQTFIDNQALSTDAGQSPSIRMQRADGSEFRASVATARIRYGGRDCHLLVVRDLSESERNRDALARSNGELQAMAARLFSLQEDERRAISRDLHDDIGQSITAMKLSAHAAMEESNPQRRRADLEQIATLADSSILKLRNLSMLLRPPQLDALGLEAALRWQCNMLFRSSMVELVLDIEPLPRRAAASTEQACFRIAQESLTNVLRHAQARHVTLTLEDDDGERLHLQVDDDGRGFDPAGPRGLGLIMMRERAQALGGTLKVRSIRDAGTRIDLYLPYQYTALLSVTAGN